MATERLELMAEWFGPVPRADTDRRDADPDVTAFHRWAASEPERLVLRDEQTLTRLNRERERREA